MDADDTLTLHEDFVMDNLSTVFCSCDLLFLPLCFRCFPFAPSLLFRFCFIGVFVCDFPRFFFCMIAACMSFNAKEDKWSSVAVVHCLIVYLMRDETIRRVFTVVIGYDSDVSCATLQGGVVHVGNV